MLLRFGKLKKKKKIVFLASPEGENCNFEVGGYEGFVNRSSIPEDIIRNVTLKNQALECMWVVTVKPNWKVSIQLIF